MELAWSLHHRQTTGTDTPHSENLVSQAPSIGDPVYFTAGQFAERKMRFQLEELQKAESGRKKVFTGRLLYAKVDRRPLDPPPAVLMRLFETNVDSDSQSWEREISYENVQNVGFMCTVDLFPLPESAYAPESSRLRSPPTPPYVGYPHAAPREETPSTTRTYFPLHPYVSPSGEGSQPTQQPFQLPRRQLMLSHIREGEYPPDVVYRVGNHLVTESSKLTPAIVGEKVVEPTIVDFKGRKAMIFVFGDIAVRREGVFILRYRAFDIFSGVAASQHAPILAELYGGPFKVYSTRDFPGLEPSTELTKSLSKYGVRVTLRDADRKSRKRSKDSHE